MFAGSRELRLGLSVLSCGWPDTCQSRSLECCSQIVHAEVPSSVSRAQLSALDLLSSQDWRVHAADTDAPPVACPTAPLCVVFINLLSPFPTTQVVSWHAGATPAP